MKPYFINVDLEIESASKLDFLEAELGRRVTVLYSGPAGKAKRRLLTLENFRRYKGPDAASHALCAIIESLSPAARRIWDRSRKVFDIGYDLPLTERAIRFTLRTDTLERVASLGATLAVSCYRGVSEEAMRLEGERQRQEQISRLTRHILAAIGPDWMIVGRVIEKVAEMDEIQLPKCGKGYEYDLIAGCIETLVREGHLAARGDIKKWRRGEVKRS